MIEPRLYNHVGRQLGAGDARFEARWVHIEDYDALVAELAKFQYPPGHRVSVAEARVRELEAALREVIAAGDTDDAAGKMYRAARKVMPAESASETPAEPAKPRGTCSSSLLTHSTCHERTPDCVEWIEIVPMPFKPLEHEQSR